MISLTKCVCSINSTVSRRYSRYVAKRDPGISRRKNVLNNADLQDDFGDMEVDDLEADFMGVHKSYKEHIRETEAKNEQLKYQIVKQKYFKEKYPNFLSWQDKDQIKFLHNKDPEDWTVEKLSESFPALPEIIKKILKARFSKAESSIKNHDSIVEKNWEDFKQGKLENLPSDLVEHLNKFTMRKLNNQNLIKKKEIVNKPKIKSDFSEIITSYEKLKNKNMDNQAEFNVKTNIQKPESDTYVIQKKNMKDKTLTTLSHLQDSIKNKSVKGYSLTEEEEIIYQDATQSEEKSIVLNQVDIKDISENKYTSSSGSSLMKKTERDYSHLIYPEKITIPKELKKRGYTYRLNDCYYDFDGLFLYRVPGMG